MQINEEAMSPRSKTSQTIFLEGDRNRPLERLAKSGKTKLSVVNYVGPGASAFMAG